jgi:hypothetical protein
MPMSACKATLHARPFAKITRFLAIFASPGILHLLMGVSVAVLSIPTLLRGGSRTTTATRLSCGDAQQQHHPHQQQCQLTAMVNSSFREFKLVAQR